MTEFLINYFTKLSDHLPIRYWFFFDFIYHTAFSYFAETIEYSRYHRTHHCRSNYRATWFIHSRKNSAINLFSTIGLLYIMFIAGLELDLNEFKSHRNKSLVFGFLPLSSLWVLAFLFVIIFWIMILMQAFWLQVCLQHIHLWPIPLSASLVYQKSGCCHYCWWNHFNRHCCTDYSGSYHGQ